MKKVAIGGGQGFWGDSPDAAIHMIRNADIQYMGCDYLAELTLSIMAKQQLKDPTKGFAPDFTTRILKEAGKEAWDKHIKICTNAGGMNINGCVDGIRQWAEGNSMSGYKIGYVTGDNIKDKIPQLLKDGWTFPNFDYDGNFNDILDKIYNCNVYIGHEGIEGCLAEGADVVITGRAADSALFLAPLKYEFGWAADDWDNLARGIMAGHLLECGGQGAGGNYMYDWRNVPRMDELGFPIAELTDDTFEITKAPDCGGIICEQSCKEQFLYEVHDPANYLTPDVNVDISHATITQVGDNRVRIGGVKGKPRPDTLKLCVGYHKGWKTVSMLSFAWPDGVSNTGCFVHHEKHIVFVEALQGLRLCGCTRDGKPAAVIAVHVYAGLRPCEHHLKHRACVQPLCHFCPQDVVQLLHRGCGADDARVGKTGNEPPHKIGFQCCFAHALPGTDGNTPML